LVARRNSLVAARRALTGERDPLPAPSVKMHLRVGEVVDYVSEHPGLTRSEIADGLGASVDAVYKHLRRNKDKFVDRGFKWYTADQAAGQ
jgi:DNA-binding CsgD family transcriptional regulator